MASKIVRASTDGDLEAVRRIYAHEVFHGLSTFEEYAPDLQEMSKRRQGVLALGLPHLVAELDGEILGFAYASRHRPRPAYNHTIENSVYVAENKREAGAGKMLLEAPGSILMTGPLPAVFSRSGKWAMRTCEICETIASALPVVTLILGGLVREPT